MLWGLGSTGRPEWWPPGGAGRDGGPPGGAGPAGAVGSTWRSWPGPVPGSARPGRRHDGGRLAELAELARAARRDGGRLASWRSWPGRCRSARPGRRDGGRLAELAELARAGLGSTGRRARDGGRLASWRSWPGWCRSARPRSSQPAPAGPAPPARQAAAVGGGRSSRARHGPAPPAPPGGHRHGGQVEADRHRPGQLRQLARRPPVSSASSARRPRFMAAAGSSRAQQQGQASSARSSPTGPGPGQLRQAGRRHGQLRQRPPSRRRPVEPSPRRVEPFLGRRAGLGRTNDSRSRNNRRRLANLRRAKGAGL